MLLPSIFEDNLFDEMMDDDFGWNMPMVSMNDMFRNNLSQSLMKTDVKDKGESYEIDIDLPGFDKKEIDVGLKDGYLTVSASHNENKDEKNDKGEYVRHERYSGSCQRTYYVGDSYKDSDIKAKFENGILELTMPKHEETKKVEGTSHIAIEG